MFNVTKIAIIENGYARDAQIFVADPDIIEKDPDWENHFVDVKYTCLYVGVFSGADEEEIKKFAADSRGVHVDVITLVDFDLTTWDNGTTVSLI